MTMTMTRAMTSQEAMVQVLEAIDHLSDTGLMAVLSAAEAMAKERGLVVDLAPTAPVAAATGGGKSWIKQVERVDWSMRPLNGSAVSGRFEGVRSIEKRDPGAIFVAKGWNPADGDRWTVMMRAAGSYQADCPSGMVTGAVRLVEWVEAKRHWLLLTPDQTGRLSFDLVAGLVVSTPGDLVSIVRGDAGDAQAEAVAACIDAGQMERAGAFAALALHGK